MGFRAFGAIGDIGRTLSMYSILFRSPYYAILLLTISYSYYSIPYYAIYTVLFRTIPLPTMPYYSINRNTRSVGVRVVLLWTRVARVGVYKGCEILMIIYFS